MPISSTDLNKAYLAYFGRPSDISGRATFANKELADVVSAFDSSAESKALYGDSIVNKINAIYVNLFNRDAEPAGLQHWLSKVMSGELTPAGVAIAILNGAQNDDAKAVANKLAAADAFTKAIDTTAEMQGYSGMAAVNSARAFLKTVNATEASLTAAVKDADTAVATATNAGSAQANQGQTFTLTTGTDIKTAATFDAPSLISVNGVGVQTLGSDDKLTGAGSADVLNATLNTAINVKPTLNGIETLNFSTTAVSNIDLGNATGVTAINHNANVAGADLTVLNLASIPAELGVQSSVATTDTLFQFQSAALAGAADTVKLKLTANGVSTAASGNINVAGLGAGVAETLDVTVVGTNRIGALSSDTAAGLGATTATNGVKTYKFSGDGSIRIDTALTGATTVDGSGLTTGGMRVTVDPALAVTVTGGKGADFVDFGAGLTNTDKFTGGDGRDTLVTSATTNTGLTTGHGITGVEILHVGGTTTAGVAASFTVDSDVTTSFDAFVDNSSAAMTYTNTVGANMADASKGLTILNNGAVTLNIKGADGLGASSDALYINIGNTTGTVGAPSQSALQTAAGVSTGTIAAANIETVTLDVKASTDLQTAAGTGVITATTLTTLNIKGGAAGEAFNVGGAGAASIVNAGNGLVKIDGSSFAGNLTVFGTNVGQAISGGSGNDFLGTGDSAAFGATVSKDILTGGAGNDIFSFRGNDATITGANLTTMDALATNKFIGMASITDLNLGGATAATVADQIDLSFVGGANVAATLGLDANAVTVVNGGAATALSGVNLGTAVNALVNGGILGAAAAPTGVAAGLFTWGGDTFLIASQQAVVTDAFGTVADSDIIIKVTGVTGTLDASDFTLFNTLTV